MDLPLQAQAKPAATAQEMAVTTVRLAAQRDASAGLLRNLKGFLQQASMDGSSTARTVTRYQSRLAASGNRRTRKNQQPSLRS